MLPQAPRSVHELRRQLDQVPPSPGIQHLLFELYGIVGVNLFGQQLQVLFGQPQGLARSWMMPLTE